MYRLLWVFLAPTFLWLALVLVGIDRFTTTSSAFPAWVFTIVWGGVIFVLSLHSYLNDESPSVQVENLKREGKTAWIAGGILLATTLSLVGGFVASRITRAAAQYLPGRHYQTQGEVRLLRSTSARGACGIYATISDDMTRAEAQVCIQVNIRAPIAPLDLKPGERVNIHQKETVLGIVVLAIERRK